MLVLIVMRFRDTIITVTWFLKLPVSALINYQNCLSPGATTTLSSKSVEATQRAARTVVKVILGAPSTAPLRRRGSGTWEGSSPMERVVEELGRQVSMSGSHITCLGYGLCLRTGINLGEGSLSGEVRGGQSSPVVAFIVDLANVFQRIMCVTRE